MSKPVSPGATVSESDISDVAPDGVDGPDFAGTRAAVLGGLFGGEQESPRFGRYRVIGTIGAGAMGRVYKAHDPELDRTVAVKVVRVAEKSTADKRRARLLREAQALAQLSHPNVVPVFESGTEGDDVFVAMEYIRGHNLAQWCQQRSRGFAEIQAVFVQAAQGLAAAHRVGLVHRDFKPENVIVGDDGRVRVVDFGLARAAMDTTSEREIAAEPAKDKESLLSTPLTRTGALLGTPAYMAPEQFRGESADPRGDQFAYCVALFEALYGRRPFPPGLAGVVEFKPRDNRDDVPAFAIEAMRRGLAERPNDRFARMEDLANALEPPKRRWWPYAAFGSGAFAFAAAWFAVSPDAETCTTAQARLDEVWNQQRRDEVSAAFIASKAHDAGDAAHRLGFLLDDYAQQWLVSMQVTCERSVEHGEIDPELFDKMTACFERRRRALGAVVDVLVEADAEVVERARLVAALDPIAPCADPQYVASQIPPPEDEELAARVAEVRDDIAHAEALDHAGKYAESLSVSEPALEIAQGLEYPPLVVEAQMQLGSAFAEMDQPKRAAPLWEKAFFGAKEIGDDATAAHAAALLINVHGEGLGDHEAATSWKAHADAEMERVGRPLRLQAIVAERFGRSKLAAGDPGGAVEDLSRSLALRREAGVDETVIVGTANNLANALIDAGRFAEAREQLLWTLAEGERLFGPEHVRVAASLLNLGTAVAQMGRFEEALQFHRKAHRIYRLNLPIDHAKVLQSMGNIALALESLGRHQEAIEHFTPVVEGMERKHGPDHPIVASSLSNLGIMTSNTGDLDGAAKLYARALSIAERAHGSTHPRVARTLVNIANLAEERGEPQEAIRAYRRALEIFEHALPADSPDLTYPLSGLGKLLVAQGDPEGIGHLERTVELRAQPGLDPIWVADSRRDLASALGEFGRDDTRRRELLEAAREGYAEAGADDRVAQVDAMLAEL